jgi:hypothetical protein
MTAKNWLTSSVQLSSDNQPFLSPAISLENLDRGHDGGEMFGVRNDSFDENRTIRKVPVESLGTNINKEK